MLVFAHIANDVVVAYPRNSSFQKILADRRTPDKVLRNLPRCTPSLREISLGVGGPRASVNGISYFLVGEFFSSDVDCAKPIQFLAVRALALIHGQCVLEDRVLLIFLKVVEVAVL